MKSIGNRNTYHNTSSEPLHRSFYLGGSIHANEFADESKINIVHIDRVTKYLDLAEVSPFYSQWYKGSGMESENGLPMNILGECLIAQAFARGSVQEGVAVGIRIAEAEAEKRAELEKYKAQMAEITDKICDHCNKTFTTKKNRDKHMEQTCKKNRKKANSSAIGNETTKKSKGQSGNVRVASEVIHDLTNYMNIGGHELVVPPTQVARILPVFDIQLNGVMTKQKEGDDVPLVQPKIEPDLIDCDSFSFQW